MRHLVYLNKIRAIKVPATLAELDPVDFLWLGLVALISGSDQYHAFGTV